MSNTNNGETKPETNESGLKAQEPNSAVFKSLNALSEKESLNEEIEQDNMLHLDESYFGMMEYEEYHLKKSKVTLFEFRADVKS